MFLDSHIVIALFAGGGFSCCTICVHSIQGKGSSVSLSIRRSRTFIYHKGTDGKYAYNVFTSISGNWHTLYEEFSKITPNSKRLLMLCLILLARMARDDEDLQKGRILLPLIIGG